MVPANSSAGVDTLLSYAKRGWPVLPIWGIKDGVCECPAGKKCKQSPGKHPISDLAPKGVHSASVDAGIIKNWLAKRPTANWAIACGHALPGGGFLVVVDVDPRNRGDESLGALEREHGALPATVTQISGGNGQHYLYRSPLALGGAVLAEGIDIKGLGGYILAEPSGHASGGRYMWDAGRHPEETLVASVPEWLLHKINARTKSRPETTGDDASNTLLGEVFKTSGMLGELLPEGKRAVCCPWVETHSDGRGDGNDSSTVLLPATPESNFGGFKCMHSHCQDRGWRDVMHAMPPHLVDAARRKYGPRPAPVLAPAASVDDPRTSGTYRTANSVGSEDWRVKLRFKQTKGGHAIEKDIANVATILRHDPRWAGKVRFNEFTQRVTVYDPPWHSDDAPASRPNDSWTEDDDTRLHMWLCRNWDFDLEVGKCAKAVRVAADSCRYHPARDWLTSLVWDGTPRVQKWLINYLGAEENAYVRLVSQWWLIAAVARLMKPGEKVDNVLILEGDQGIRKSGALRALASPEWFMDSPITLGDKDSYLSLRGKWIVELAELDSLNKADSSKAKAFFSSQVDSYRPPYGKDYIDVPRQCIFAGTVNHGAYLKDETGNRRYWPVKCYAVDVKGLTEVREQLWAEALHLYSNGECWWPSTNAERDLCSEEQEDRFVGDDWLLPISEFLTGRETATNNLVAAHLGIPIERLDKYTSSRIGTCIVKLGWKRDGRVRVGKAQFTRYVKNV